jgi:hypothetical protein
MKVFTRGQVERMNWFIENVRSSLLNCPSCLDPCPYNTTALFSPGSSSIAVGTNLLLTNLSSGADQYEWYVDDTLKSTSINLNYSFNKVKKYSVKLVAKKSGSPEVTSAVNNSFSSLM